MKKILAGDLAGFRNKIRRELDREKTKARVRVTVHMGTCGIAAGAEDILGFFRQEVQRAGLEDVIVKTTGCAGLCSQEPMVTIRIKDNPPVKYGGLNPTKASLIFKRHVAEGRVVNKMALATGSERRV